MQLQRFELGTSSLAIDPAKDELERYIETKSDGQSQTWGYFPEMNPDTTDYPETLRLISNFDNIVVAKQPVLQKLGLQLAFVRRATSEPVSEFGGFHVDANAGISHMWPTDVNQTKEVFRILFNLDSVPRTLSFYPYTLEDLRNQGIDIPRDHYEMLNNLPDTLQQAAIDIPPIEAGAVYALSFISTQIPHAGKTTQNGHFLITYGAYIDLGQIRQLF